jgi:4-hydroxythreonine-4-phosphate dehydrogenase
MLKSCKKPVFGVTLGDPLGIGPEIVLKALKQKHLHKLAEFKIFGDSNIGVSYQEATQLTPAKRNKAFKKAGQLARESLDSALESLKKNEVQAIITAPVSKTHLNRAGFPFAGQTEYIASFWPKQKASMMLASKKLKVVLVTIHQPLKNIFKLITQKSVLEKIQLTHLALQNDFGIKAPRIAVCGLNPHAGENGLLGCEDRDIIFPAIKQAQRQGINASGPHASDTLFYWAIKGQYDAVVCMYHDQGLIPLKTLAMDEGVNITLGLPVIRTSPDHGCAFDIAGRNQANPQSMIESIKMAHQIWQNRKNCFVLR